MVWHEPSDESVIIMLTPFFENGRDRCHKYFPLDPQSDHLDLEISDANGNPYIGTLRVVDKVEDEPSRSTIRTLRLTGSEGREKMIHHFHFLAWPDYGVPMSEVKGALEVLSQQTRERSGGWANRRIVHCSAGVGRTGTFIALEHLLDELESGQLDKSSNLNAAEETTAHATGSTQDSSTASTILDLGQPHYLLPHRITADPVFYTVNRLREQRMTMVQSETQYAFLYEFLADAWRQRRASLSASPTPSTNALSPEAAVPSKPPTLKIPPPLRPTTTGSLPATHLPDPPRSAPATTLQAPDTTLPIAPASAIVAPASAINLTAPEISSQPASPTVRAPPHRLEPTGEPLPKAVRLSRGLKSMFSGMQMRSASATRKLREPKPGTPTDEESPVLPTPDDVGGSDAAGGFHGNLEGGRNAMERARDAPIETSSSDVD